MSRSIRHYKGLPHGRLNKDRKEDNRLIRHQSNRYFESDEMEKSKKCHKANRFDKEAFSEKFIQNELTRRTMGYKKERLVHKLFSK